MIYYKKIQSPIGKMILVGTDQHLTSIVWKDAKVSKSWVLKDQHPILCKAERQLKEYFEGRRERFDLPIKFDGTEFQKKVWSALTTIPFGETRSYGMLARQIGNPKASRAVGAANRKNPLGIVVPCHRVIGAKGDLVGFAGGLKVKKTLLNLERYADTICDQSQ